MKDQSAEAYHSLAQLLGPNDIAVLFLTALWISPALAGKPGGLEYVGSVSTGAKFYHYQLDIGGDLDTASAAMVKKVTALLPV